MARAPLPRKDRHTKRLVRGSSLIIFEPSILGKIEALPPGTCKSNGCVLMSALGQKQTFASQKAMSALPPKTDMCGARVNVRYGPVADIKLTADLKARHPIRQSGAQCSFELLFGPLYHVVELLAPLREFRHQNGIDGQIVDLGTDFRSGRRPS